ncbi:MAG: hypothetical protein C9356_05765 [Oleiphilus sp.]|nr:MAG: hypothetical protein C9356_05765 [Oleiphilus sp.]
MKNILQSCLIVASVILGSVNVAKAAQITGTDLLNLLVSNGVIDMEQAKVLADEVNRSDQRPSDEPVLSADALLEVLVAQGVLGEESVAQLQDKARRREQAETERNAEEVEQDIERDVIRVPYIPDYVRQEMHESLKFSVEADVVDKVKEEAVRTARVYGWGIKEAPSWVHKLKISGDGRLRYQGDFAASDNASDGLPDFDETNDNGAVRFDQVQDDRHRLRSRFRLLFEAKPFERIDLGLRFTTGDQGNPVSSNQTLGSFGQKWESHIDLGYIRHRAITKDYTLIGGRFKSPFLHTDLTFDSDMSFEGISGTYYFKRDDTIYGGDSQWDPYFTAGAFPIDELHAYVNNGDTYKDVVSTNNDQDKYLLAAQLGTDYKFYNTNLLSVGLAYYHYTNIKGERNAAGSNATDNTASDFYQVGNSVFDISDQNSDVRYGLASDFRLLNATIKYRMANFHPTFLFLHGDVVKNLAFDENAISALTGVPTTSRDLGYQVGFSLGTLKVKYLRDWQLSFIYRHLEGDAVLDAFADSDFLLGGTDSEGYIIRAKYGVLDNTIAGLSWLSADAIDTPPGSAETNISMDTLQLDITAKF